MHFAVSVLVSVAGIASLFGPSLAQAYWPIIAFLWFSMSEQQVDADQSCLCTVQIACLNLVASTARSIRFE